MKLRNLTEEETQSVFVCIECVANGKVILHDFEFQTIFGIEVKELLKIYRKWPKIDESSENVKLAINNSMNNLLGYPHARHHNWEQYCSVPLEEIARILRKWRGDSASSYFEGIN